jgi:hypothetical protein
VDTLCHHLNLPVVRVLETEQTLSELADLAQRWIKMRSLPVSVETMHCDDRLATVASFDTLLVEWAATPAETRPIYMVQFDGAFMSNGDEDTDVRMAIVVAYDKGRQVVTFGEASVRHHACVWTTPIVKLWDACAAVGSFGRTGGVLCLNLSGSVSPKPHKRALGDNAHSPMLHEIVHAPDNGCTANVSRTRGNLRNLDWMCMCDSGAGTAAVCYSDCCNWLHIHRVCFGSASPGRGRK